MDLGITGRWAIVCAASQGLGKGCAEALGKEGVNLVINARTQVTLEQTASELRAACPGIEVRTVAGDVADAQVRQALLAACPQVDILVNNAGGPPPGDFRDWGRDDWLKALDANMLTPIELIKAVVDGMAERGFGRVVNIEARRGEGADRHFRAVQRRPQWPDRFHCRPGSATAPGGQQCHTEQPAAWGVRHGAFAKDIEGGGW
ncbi:hypothetical protein DBADOPDK_03962 [Pseudomonas sp. MM223]|nr:hypothetical protein DBADOPDK_03962 [Pseudomonas sp. MM223]